jgi:hypothetical protein
VIVPRQSLPPGHLPNPSGGGCGAHQVSEEERREDPVVRALAKERPSARPFNRLEALITYDPAVVPRRKLVDIQRTYFDLVAITG